MGTRIYELSKKLGKTNKQLLDALQGLGITGKSHSSALDDDTVRKLTEILTGSGPGRAGAKQKPEPAKTEKPVEKIEKPLKTHPKRIPEEAPTVKAPEIKVKAPEMKPEQRAEAGKKVQKEVPAPIAPQAEKAVPSIAETPSTAAVPAVPGIVQPEEETELKVPDRFKKDIEAEKVEKFRAKPDAQRAFQAIRKIDQKKWLDRRGIKGRPKDRSGRFDESTVTAPRKKTLKIEEGATVKDFAEIIGVKSSEVIKKFMELGYMPTINQPVDIDAALLVAEGLGVKLELAATDESSAEEQLSPEAVETLSHRPPVVTIMGHVDHGKTSLLDSVRKTKVTETEAGGITQHIGAYKVSLKGKEIVFLDTPGHEAFTALRARGAKVTDIVVLVVAADDGVKPQTIEAINHAKAAGVPIVVAINKIDKPEANPAKVKNELAEHGIVSEEWGGTNIFAEISAKQRIGIESLLELILLQAEIMELKANPDRMAKGVIIEARLDRGRGPIATVLVQNGTLRIGDAFLAGANAGKVRALVDDSGKRIHEAGPATPVEVIGFGNVPNAGDTFVVMEDEKKARQIALSRHQKQRFVERAATRKLTLDEIYAKIKEGAIKELGIVIKGDVQGSVEALRDSLERITHAEVKVRVIHSSVGGINESDVMLAAASNAIVIGFNVRAETKAMQAAEREGVDMRYYNVIYEAIDEVKKALEGMLEPTLKEKVLGRAEVRQTFQVSRLGTIAGCYVLDGTMSRSSDGIRVIRDNIVIFEGKMSSLKRFKEDVREVQAGYECGIMLENFNDMKEGDVIENFVIEKVAAKL